MIDICVLSLDNYKLNKRFLKSLDNVKIPYRLIWVDNGSKDKTKILLKELEELNNLEAYEKYIVIKNKENIGVAKARNQGLNEFRKSDSIHILICDNDIVIPEKAVEQMISIIENNNRIGIVGSLGTSPEQKEYWKNWNIDKDFDNVNVNAMFCSLINGRLARQQSFDETYELMYNEDYHYCRQAIKNNYKVVLNLKSVVTHDKGATAKNLDLSESTKKNGEYYNKIWK